MVDRVHCPSREVLEQYVLQSKPFIIVGEVEKWPCYSNWCKDDYLKNKLGDREVPVREMGYNVGEWLGKTTNVKFSEFYSKWSVNENKLNSNKNSNEDGQKQDKESKQENTEERKNKFSNDNNSNSDTTPKFYLASLPVKTYFPELESEYTVPEFARQQNKSANLWVGNKGQVTPLHHDWSTGDPGMDGLHAIIIGQKLFKLYDPELNARYIKRKKDWGLFHHALVNDCENPDYDRFPEFRQAQCIDVILNQGEILFIPKLWWHHVRTLEQSISLNFWFQHLGSESLKLNRFWCHMEEYIEAVYQMKVAEERFSTLLMYYGDGFNQKNKPTSQQMQEYFDQPIKFLLLPKFIQSFSNASNNPLVKCEEGDQLAQSLRTKVREYIENKAKSLNYKF